MPLHVLQLSDWRGEAFKQRETILLCQGRREAVCELWTHRLGWHLRLIAAGELLRTQVCQDQEQVFATSEEWKKAMVEKGWQ